MSIRHGQYSPNDMRSMSRNPNSPHFKAGRDNRSNQLNPQHPSFGHSHAGSGLQHEGASMPRKLVDMARNAPRHLGGYSVLERLSEMGLGSMLSRSLVRMPGVSSAIMSPSFVIAYSVLPGAVASLGGEPVPSGRVDRREFTLVLCRPTPEDRNCLAALNRAQMQYPEIRWRVVDGIDPRPQTIDCRDFGSHVPLHVPLDLVRLTWRGEDPPYCAMRLTPETDIDRDAIQLVCPAPFFDTHSMVQLNRDGRIRMEDLVGLNALEDLQDPTRHIRGLL